MKKYIRSATGDLSLQLFSDAREILDYFKWHNRNLNKRQDEILSDLSDAVDSGSTIAVREAIGNLKFNSKNFTNEQYYIVTDLYNELCTSGGKYESIGRYNDIESSTSIECSEYTSENPLLVECPRGPYYVWEEFGTFKGSTENPNSRITNAFRVQTFDGFDSLDEVVDYVKKYF